MLVLIRNAHLIIKYLPSSSPHLAARFLPERRGFNSPECNHSRSLSLVPIHQLCVWNLSLIYSALPPLLSEDEKNKGSLSSGATNKPKGHQSKSPEGVWPLL